MTSTEIPEGSPPDHFDEFELVLLWSAQDRPALGNELAERLQSQHLGHLEAMRVAGHLLVPGPVVEQPTARLRGMCIYRTGSIERARELASADPAVRAGQLEIEAMGWLARPNALHVGE